MALSRAAQRRARLMPRFNGAWEPLEARRLLTDFSWVGGFLGNQWDAEANWMNLSSGKTTDGVPGALDTAILASGPNITSLGKDITIGVLTIDVGFKDMQLATGPHTLTLHGGTIRTGTLQGNFLNTGTLTIDVPSEFVDSPQGAPLLWGNLRNDGTIRHVNGRLATSRYLDPIGHILNAENARYEFTGAGALINEWGVGTFTNQGLLVMDAPDAVAILGAALRTEGAGRIQVVQGTLSLQGSEHTLQGTVDVGLGATLDVLMAGPSSSISVPGDLNVTGSGLLRVRQGTVVMNGGTLRADDAQVRIEASEVATANLQGTGRLEVEDLVLRSGRIGRESFGGSPFNTVFENFGSISLSGEGVNDAYFGNATLVNHGKLIVTGGTSGFALVGGAIDNRGDGTIRITRDVSIGSAFGNGVGPSFLMNAGTIAIDDGVTSVSFPGIVFQNRSTGVIDVRSGTFDLSTARHWDASARSYSTGGLFRIATGAQLRLDEGQLELAGVYHGEGGGQLVLGNTTLVGALLDFPRDMLHWTHGNLRGTFTNRGDMVVSNDSPGSFNSLSGAMTNEGTLRLLDNTLLHLSSGFAAGPGRVINAPSGVLEMSGGNTIFGSVNGPLSTDQFPIVVNQGTLRLTQGIAKIDPKFENLGTVETAGALTLSAPRVQISGLARSVLSGEWIARAGGTIQFPELLSTVSGFNGNFTVSGAGSQINGLDGIKFLDGSLALLDGATWSLPGDLINSGSIKLDAGSQLIVAKDYVQTPQGRLDFTVAGVNDVGELMVSGTASLSGDLVTNLEFGFAPDATQQFDVVLAQQIQGDFRQVTANGLVASVSQAKVTLAAPEAVADLMVDAVSVSANRSPVEPGSEITIDYTVHNLSGLSISEHWTDQIFFSTDPQLDLTDQLLSRVSVSTGITAFGTIQRRETLVAPDGLGRGYLIVATDSTGRVFDMNRRNNVAATTERIEFAVAELKLGESRTIDLSGQQPAYYRLTIPDGTAPVRLQASFAATQAGEIRVMRGEMPRGGANELVASSLPSANGRAAVIDLADATPGVYFISVSSPTSGSAMLRADPMSLDLTSVDGAPSGSLMDGDAITLTVRGTGFDTATQFRLGPHVAATTDILDATSAVVHFANISAGGPWALTARNASAEVTLGQPAFIVSARPTDPTATLPDWTVVVNMPSIVRPEREIPVSVTFRNNSQVSQPAPIMRLTTDNGQFRLANSERYGGSEYYVLGVKPTGRPDDYAPGESSEIKLYLLPTEKGPHVFSNVEVTLLFEQLIEGQVSSSDGSLATPRVSPITLSNEMIDSLRPAYIELDAWETVVKPNFLQLVGNSRQSLATAIRHAAAHLQRDQSNTYDVNRLIANLINEADDFGSISSRFRMTAFGRGIENPFDIHLERDDQGNLVLFSGFVTSTFTKVGTAFQSAPGDRRTLSERDAGGWQVTEPDGSFAVFRDDGLWDFTTDRFGNRVTASYVDRQLVSTVDSNGKTTLLEYASNGQITKLTEDDGRVTTFAYDVTGELLTSFTSPLGTTTLAYTGQRTGPQAFAIQSITSPGGARVFYEYDDWGRLSRVSGADGALSRRVSYGVAAHLGEITATDTQGQVTTVVRGEFGQLSALRDATGRTVDFRFDQLGRVTELNSTTSTYFVQRDSYGHATRILGPRGDLLSATYDSDGVNATSVSDPLGRVTRFDVQDGLTKLQTLPNGNTTSYSYDARGYATIVQTPGGHWQRRTIDERGLLTRIEYSDGSIVEYVYDVRQNLNQVKETSASGSAQIISFIRDEAGRIVRVTDAANRWIDYGYNADGYLIKVSTFDGQTTDYDLDSLNRATAVRYNGKVQVRYEYNDVGQLTRKLFANDTTTQYGYDAAGRVLRIDHRFANGNSIDFVEYAYDASGRVSTVTTPVGTRAYTYDGWGQLLTVTLPNGQTQEFDADAAGNRVGYEVNSVNQYLTSAAGDEFVYDQEGNLTVVAHPDGTVTQYTYDDRNRVRSMSGADGMTTFEYDALGNRSAVVRNGIRTEYLLDLLGITDRLAEYENGSRSASYLLAGGLEGRFDANNSASFYHFDATGNTLALTAADGSVSASYSYSPFGEVIESSGTLVDVNPFTFNGRTGAVSIGAEIYDMRARLYDASTGRFTQFDPSGLQGQDTNWYRFARNNPLSYVDPTGYDPIKPVKPNPKPGDKPHTPEKPIPPKKETPPPPATEPYNPDKVPTEYVPDPDRDDDTQLPFQPQILDPQERARQRLDRLRDLGDRLDRDQQKADADTVFWGSATAFAFGGLVIITGGAVLGAGATNSVAPTVLYESAPTVGRIIIGTGAVVGLTTAGAAEQQTPNDPNEIVGPSGYGPSGFRQAVG
ncbi:MAG: hypothetical protein KDB23_10180, partial [Planctomycetales bacterium]|nr:hypothetical protein [Planctomycetales bacterium]